MTQASQHGTSGRWKPKEKLFDRTLPEPRWSYAPVIVPKRKRRWEPHEAKR